MDFLKKTNIKNYEEKQSIYVAPKRIDSTKDWDEFDDIITRAEFIFGRGLYDGDNIINENVDLEYFVNFEYVFSNSRTSLNFLIKIEGGGVDVTAFLDSDWKNPKSTGFSIFSNPIPLDEIDGDIIFGVVIDWREFGNVALYINDSDLIELSSNFSLHDGSKVIFGFGARVPEYNKLGLEGEISLGFRTKETEREDVKSFQPMLTNKMDTPFKNKLSFTYKPVTEIRRSTSYILTNHFGILEGYESLRKYRSDVSLRKRSEIRNFTVINEAPTISNGTDSTLIEKKLSEVVGNPDGEVMTISTASTLGSQEGVDLYKGYTKLLDSLSGLYDASIPNSLEGGGSSEVLSGEYNTPNTMTAFQTRFFINGEIPSLTKRSMNEALAFREQIFQIDFTRGFIGENEIDNTNLSGLDGERITTMADAVSNIIPFDSNAKNKTFSLVMVVNTTLSSNVTNRSAKLYVLPQSVWGDSEEVLNRYHYDYKSGLQSWDVQLSDIQSSGVTVTTYINSDKGSIGVVINGKDYGYIIDDHDFSVREFGQQKTSPLSFKVSLMERGHNIIQNNNAPSTKMGVEFIWNKNGMVELDNVPKSKDINNVDIGSGQPYNIEDGIRSGTYFNSVETHGENRNYFNNNGFGIDLIDEHSMRIEDIDKHIGIYKRFNSLNKHYSLFSISGDGSKLIPSGSSHNTIFNIHEMAEIPNSDIFLYKQLATEGGEFRMGGEYPLNSTLGFRLSDLDKGDLENYFIGLSLKSLRVGGEYEGYAIRDIKLGVEWDSNNKRTVKMYYVCSAARLSNDNIEWMKKNSDSNETLKVFTQTIPILKTDMTGIDDNPTILDFSFTRTSANKILVTVNGIYMGEILPYNSNNRELRSGSNEVGVMDGKQFDGGQFNNIFSLAIESFPTNKVFNNEGLGEVTINIKENNAAYLQSHYYPLETTNSELRTFTEVQTLRNDLQPSRSIDKSKFFRYQDGGKILIYNRAELVNSMRESEGSPVEPIYVYDIGNPSGILTRNITDYYGNYGKVLYHRNSSVGEITKEYEGVVPIVSEFYSNRHQYRHNVNSTTKYVYLNGFYYTIEGITGGQKIIKMDGSGEKIAEISQLPTTNVQWEDIISLADDGYLVAASKTGAFSINPDNPSSAQYVEYNSETDDMGGSYKIEIHDVGGGYALITFRSRRCILIKINSTTPKIIDSSNPLEEWDMGFYTATRGPVNSSSFYVLEASHNLNENVFSSMWVYTINKETGEVTQTSTDMTLASINSHGMDMPTLWSFDITFENHSNSAVNNLITYKGVGGDVFITSTANITTEIVGGRPETRIKFARLGGIG